MSLKNGKIKPTSDSTLLKKSSHSTNLGESVPPVGSDEYFKELSFRRKHRKHAIRSVIETLPEFHLDDDEITKVDYPTTLEKAGNVWRNAPPYAHWLIYFIAAITPIILALIEALKHHGK